MANKTEDGKQPRGRPKLYSREVLVRFTDDEDKRLKLLVNASGMSLSRLLVETTLSGELPTFETVRQRAQCLLQLRRASSDLKEAVRLLHADFGHKVSDYTELTRALTALELAAKEVEKSWAEALSK